MPSPRHRNAVAAVTLAVTLVATTAAGSVAGATTRDPFARPAVAPQGDPARAALRNVATHGAAVRADAAQDFTVTGVLVDPDGTSHVRLARSYRGLPVLGGDLVVHQGRSGGWRGRSQTLDEIPTLGVTPAVGPARARAAALAPSRVTRSISGARTTGSRLVVDATGATPRLAYEVLSGGVQDDGTPSRLATYVDARSGSVIRTEQQIENVIGSGRSLYAGTVALNLTLSGSTYQLKDETRGGTFTTDLRNGTDPSSCVSEGQDCPIGTLFTSPDPSFGNGATTSRESAAVDAQYGSDETWDYYQQVHGRDGIFGTGRGSFNRVHYGRNYANAFWDGTAMTFGDGDGQRFGPLTSLDVTAHEMSHGVTEHTADLRYSGEPGGLNESTSDIFGTAVEFHAGNPADPGDYLLGEEFDTAGQGFRRMDRPSSDGASADCWTATVGQLDVHYSAGVGNHFFYLLSEGSGARTVNGVAYHSSTCSSAPAVTRIGRRAAARIWYRALTVYMTSGTTYHGARTASLDAATDLYGAGSTQRAAVDAAWDAVNVR